MSSGTRSDWTSLTDEQLLAQCAVDTYRASGPGGQKRNKTSSAVRIRHAPSELLVIAEESRSQHENRARALRRLRKAFVLQIREQVPVEELTPELLGTVAEVAAVRTADGRLSASSKEARYWAAAGVLLDVLLAFEGRLSEAAQAVGVSTAQLGDFLRLDDKVWEQTNLLRRQFGHKLLR
jgi:RF-1 domain